MTSRIIMALVLAVTLAGCGGRSGSSLNPLNWFGGSENKSVANAVDSRNLVSQVLSLRVEQVPGGAIIHATGLPPRQGFFNGDLIPLNTGDANGVLAFEFRNASPFNATRVGTQQSREVIVGRFVSQQSLQNVSRISVRGASNVLTVRR